MSPPLLLVVNASASGVRGPRGPAALRDALRAAGGHVDVEVTHSVEDLRACMEAADGRRVVLAGGDGTVHAAAACDVPDVELALIPAGRANNVAHALGIPVEPEQAVDLAVRGTARPLDAIETRTARGRVVAVEGLSVGFLAMARTRYHASNSAHPLAAVRAGVAAVGAFHPLEVRVSLPDGPELLHVAQLFVANLSLYLSGWPVAPDADPRDGLLDIVAIDGRGRTSIPGMLMRLRRGTHLGHHGVTVRRVASLRLSTGGRSPVIADSDDLGLGPVDVRVLPGALRLVAPAP